MKFKALVPLTREHLVQLSPKVAVEHTSTQVIAMDLQNILHPKCRAKVPPSGKGQDLSLLASV